MQWHARRLLREVPLAFSVEAVHIGNNMQAKTLHAACRGFEFTMAASPSPRIGSTTERLQVNTTHVSLAIRKGGQLLVKATGLTAHAYKVGGPPASEKAFRRFVLRTAMASGHILRQSSPRHSLTYATASSWLTS